MENKSSMPHCLTFESMLVPSGRSIKVPFAPVQMPLPSRDRSSITCDNINCQRNILYGKYMNGERVMSVCSNCHADNAAHYCSKDCQKADRKSHKHWCGKITNILVNVDEIITVSYTHLTLPTNREV